MCTSVNFQRQPTLFRLSRRHLDNGKRQPIILAPWSLRATLLPDQPKTFDDLIVRRVYTGETGFLFSVAIIKKLSASKISKNFVVYN